jgi:IPT/TIG domain-containing protein
MSKRPLSKSPTLSLGVALLLIGVTLAYLLVAFWPRTKVDQVRQHAVSAVAAPAGQGGRDVEILVEKKSWADDTVFLWTSFKLDADVRLLVLVLLAGTLGSYVHAAQSFASYVGNARFKTTWTWWYILRMPMGAALAVFVYFGIRGGLLAAGTATGAGAANELNLYGIMSFSGLAGLFSKQAADKLAEVFDTLFATKEDRKREDKLTENPRPELTSVSPESVPAGAAADLALIGQGFVKESVVKVSGKDLTTIFVNAQGLMARLGAADIGSRSELEVKVVNPEPGGGESKAKIVTVKAAAEGLAPVTPISREANPAESAQAPQ